jgi:hypothetical protein
LIFLYATVHRRFARRADWCAAAASRGALAGGWSSPCRFVRGVDER